MPSWQAVVDGAGIALARHVATYFEHLHQKGDGNILPSRVWIERELLALLQQYPGGVSDAIIATHLLVKWQAGWRDAVLEEGEATAAPSGVQAVPLRDLLRGTSDHKRSRSGGGSGCIGGGSSANGGGECVQATVVGVQPAAPGAAVPPGTPGMLLLQDGSTEIPAEMYLHSHTALLLASTGLQEGCQIRAAPCGVRHPSAATAVPPRLLPTRELGLLATDRDAALGMLRSEGRCFALSQALGGDPPPGSRRVAGGVTEAVVVRVGPIAQGLETEHALSSRTYRWRTVWLRDATSAAGTACRGGEEAAGVQLRLYDTAVGYGAILSPRDVVYARNLVVATESNGVASGGAAEAWCNNGGGKAQQPPPQQQQHAGRWVEVGNETLIAIVPASSSAKRQHRRSVAAAAMAGKENDAPPPAHRTLGIAACAGGAAAALAARGKRGGEEMPLQNEAAAAAAASVQQAGWEQGCAEGLGDQQEEGRGGIADLRPGMDNVSLLAQVQEVCATGRSAKSIHLQVRDATGSSATVHLRFRASGSHAVRGLWPGHWVLMSGLRASVRAAPSAGGAAQGQELELEWRESGSGGHVQSLTGLPALLSTPALFSPLVPLHELACRQADAICVCEGVVAAPPAVSVVRLHAACGRAVSRVSLGLGDLFAAFDDDGGGDEAGGAGGATAPPLEGGSGVDAVAGGSQTQQPLQGGEDAGGCLWSCPFCGVECSGGAVQQGYGIQLTLRSSDRPGGEVPGFSGQQQQQQQRCYSFRLSAGAAAGFEGAVGMPPDDWTRLKPGARQAALRRLVGAMLRLAVYCAGGDGDGGNGLGLTGGSTAVGGGTAAGGGGVCIVNAARVLRVDA